LIGWDKNILCFIEVKTRTDDSFAPPSAAVTQAKQRHIVAVARRYLRGLPGARPPSCRFDVLSIVPAAGTGGLQVTLHKGAFAWDADKPRRNEYRDLTPSSFRERRK
jgi:putative endonuclease